jgi:dipeptidyl aminopeptidase/acylaminoacyl peptidase
MPTPLQLEHNAPWKQRFRLPEIFGMQISCADPQRGLLTSNVSGQDRLYAWHIPTGEEVCLTNGADGVWFGVLSPDGRYVYYLEDRHGDEIGHLVRVPYEGGQPQDITPDMPPYAVPFESEIFGLSISRQANMLGFTTAAEDGSHLYSMELGAAGELATPRKLYDASKLIIGPLFSYGGELAMLASTEFGEGMQYSLLAFDLASGQIIATLQDEGSSIVPLMCSSLPGDMRFLATTNRSGYNRPVIWNPRTGERRDVPLSELEGEVFPCDWSGDGKRLLLKQFSQAVPQLYVYDLENNSLKKLAHPVYGDIGTAQFGPAGAIYASCDDSTHPTQFVLLDEETGKQVRVVLASAEPPTGHPFRSITFPSSDGQIIQAWLAVPEGTGPFPTILGIHGGPDVVATAGFWPRAQVWLDHGFAYISVNYRGSTSFGRAFQEKIWGNPGYWEVEDMVAARKWLVENGIAHPQQVFTTGWSWGGYLTLHALSLYPDLWAGGMAGVAVTDCAMSWEDEADTLKAYDVTLFKGTPQERPEVYRASSPITYAEQVVAPIVIIQGRNDTRCPPRQVEVYEAKMKALGKDIEVHWFDAGHISMDTEMQIEHQELFLRFAYRVLGL